MEGRIFISVILPLRLEWEPCYAVEGDGSGIVVGDRVRVDFAGRNYVGVVSEVGIEPCADVAKIKTAVKDTAGMGRVLPEEIELWRMVADYYLCTVGEVCKAAYPVGKTNMEEALALARQKAARRAEVEVLGLRARLERVRESIARKEELIARSRKEAIREKYVAERDCAIEKAGAIEERMKRLESGITGQSLITVESPRYAESGSSEVSGSKEESGMVISTGKHICLTEAQEKAVVDIREGFDHGKPVLLHGITGSGKTEIYLKLASEVIANGRNVLYLVPEIALSRQLEDRLRIHFPDELLVFHSGETAARKRDTADIIRSSYGKQSLSKSYILLGTRSSVFLPHHDLGLIIVDEEHDTSYKQDSPAPRYNGRDTALMLSRIHGCNVLMGTATPSLEELYNCLTGKHEIVRLSRRYHGADDAEIEIIDTKAERRKRGMVGNISRKLIGDIQEVLGRGGQIMILRARRAWATVMQCASCGEIQKCPRCNVSLSLHRDNDNIHIGGRMVCHYCGWSAPYTGRCSKCSGELSLSGSGTQKIEEEIAALFPQARIARLDSDTAQDNSYARRMIEEFSEGRTDILVGTQIVTKGFDFSNLQLVAVIAADSLLGMQDFRADEKAMQILEQFRGRCGRRGAKGKFVIQTSQPEHPVYQRIMDGQTESFTSSLLMERKEFGFPPFSRIVELQIKDRFEDRASRMASELGSILNNRLAGIYGNNMTILTGPYTPIPDKLADNYLRMIRISLPKDRNLKHSKAILKGTVNEFEKQRKYDGHIMINVDPS
ncbi:MAG: primosomal protein N' [Candidatus Cryptobacteroides sp.]